MPRTYKMSCRKRLSCRHCGMTMQVNNLKRHLVVHHGYPNDETSSRQYYDDFLKGENEGCCSWCGSETEFINMGRGYSDLCISCGQSERKRTETKEKRKKSFLEKYGVECGFKLPQLKAACKSRREKMTPEERRLAYEKIRETKRLRYGDPDFMMYGSKSYRSRMNDLHGDPNFMSFGSVEFVKTVEKQHGWKNVAARAEISRRAHFLSTIGVDNPWKDPTIYRKCLETKLKKYGKVIPYNGRHSKVSVKFFTLLSERLERMGLDLSFANHPQEHRIDIGENHFFVDAFCPQTGKAIEFFGDYWHANPSRYGPNDEVHFPGGTSSVASSIWKCDDDRLKLISSSGVDCTTVWERDVRTDLERTLNSAVEWISQKKEVNSELQVSN